jgi:multiple sugar transport system ATP-binding protein
MATVELKRLKKVYNRKVEAVKGIDLTVRDGEFLVLLGPSGCGKTTTMRMIAGLEEITEGEVLIDGQSVGELPPRKRNVSMIFQNYAVWPHMTVFENIAYALKIKKMDKGEVEERVKEVANLSGIEGLLDRYPDQLSGGQQQRVAVARAIAVRPQVFLMDEPLSNLDAKLRVQMRTDLKEIHRSTGATTVFVTHDQSEAMSLADRIVIMKDGAIIQIGTPDEVYHNSANRFVADFIGTPPTNFLSVSVGAKEEDGYRLKGDHLDFVANHPSLAGFEGKEILLGVRPENIDILEDAPIEAVCRLIEPQGSHNIVLAEIGEQRMKLSVNPDIDLKIDQPFRLRLKSGHYHFFDPETGERLDK